MTEDYEEDTNQETRKSGSSDWKMASASVRYGRLFSLTDSLSFPIYLEAD
jgi:hypothetical protein